MYTLYFNDRITIGKNQYNLFQLLSAFSPKEGISELLEDVKQNLDNIKEQIANIIARKRAGGIILDKEYQVIVLYALAVLQKEWHEELPKTSLLDDALKYFQGRIGVDAIFDSYWHMKQRNFDVAMGVKQEWVQNLLDPFFGDDRCVELIKAFNADICCENIITPVLAKLCWLSNSTKEEELENCRNAWKRYQWQYLWRLLEFYPLEKRKMLLSKFNYVLFGENGVVHEPLYIKNFLNAFPDTEWRGIIDEWFENGFAPFGMMANFDDLSMFFKDFPENRRKELLTNLHGTPQALFGGCIKNVEDFIGFLSDFQAVDKKAILCEWYDSLFDATYGMIKTSQDLALLFAVLDCDLLNELTKSWKQFGFKLFGQDGIVKDAHDLGVLLEKLPYENWSELAPEGECSWVVFSNGRVKRVLDDIKDLIDFLEAFDNDEWVKVLARLQKIDPVFGQDGIICSAQSFAEFAKKFSSKQLMQILHELQKQGVLFGENAICEDVYDFHTFLSSIPEEDRVKIFNQHKYGLVLFGEGCIIHDVYTLFQALQSMSADSLYDVIANNSKYIFGVRKIINNAEALQKFLSMLPEGEHSPVQDLYQVAMGNGKVYVPVPGEVCRVPGKMPPVASRCSMYHSPFQVACRAQVAEDLPGNSGRKEDGLKAYDDESGAVCKKLHTKQ